MEEQKELPVFDAALFGRRVVTRRKNLKKKQIELAEQVGISQQHMSGIELGNDRVSFDVFLKTMHCFECKSRLPFGRCHTV